METVKAGSVHGIRQAADGDVSAVTPLSERLKKRRKIHDDEVGLPMPVAGLPLPPLQFAVSPSARVVLPSFSPAVSSTLAFTPLTSLSAALAQQSAQAGKADKGRLSPRSGRLQTAINIGMPSALTGTKALISTVTTSEKGSAEPLPVAVSAARAQPFQGATPVAGAALTRHEQPQPALPDLASAASNPGRPETSLSDRKKAQRAAETQASATLAVTQSHTALQSAVAEVEAGLKKSPLPQSHTSQAQQNTPPSPGLKITYSFRSWGKGHVEISDRNEQLILQPSDPVVRERIALSLVQQDSAAWQMAEERDGDGDTSSRARQQDEEEQC